MPTLSPTFEKVDMFTSQHHVTLYIHNARRYYDVGYHMSESATTYSVLHTQWVTPGWDTEIEKCNVVSKYRVNSRGSS